MGEDWDNWAQIIRSSLTTSKFPITAYEIDRDVKTIEGKSIPYRAFQFNNLEAMLRKIPRLQAIQDNGKVVFKVLPTKETEHIFKMVQKQKPSKKKQRTVLNRFTDVRKSYAAYNNRPYNQTFGNRNVPNKFSVQNRVNGSFNNSYSRSYSVEPQKRPLPPSTGHSAPTRNFSFDATKTTSAPPKQRPITPPSTLQKQRPVSPPSTSQKPTPALPVSSKAAASFSIQSRLSPPPLMQQKVEMSKMAQRLSNAQQRPIAVPKVAAQQHKIPAPAVDDPRLRLNNYTDARNLPLPKYIDATIKTNGIYYSAVVINDKKYSSYPKEAKSNDEAEKFAAQAALDALIQDITPPTITKDEALILKRVLEIVKNRPNGIFETCVVETYRTKYDEGLPKNWLKMVEYAITVDVGANDLCILSPLSKSVSDNLSNSSDAHSQLLADPEPEPLKLNDMAEFWFHVFVVYSTTDIWGVIIDEDHSDKIDELGKEMKNWYDANDSLVHQIIPGKHYALLDSGFYHRVRCMKVDPENQKITVFFIDRGDEDIYPVTSLRSLRHEFCQLPAQSVRISMVGLETFAGYEEADTLLEEMLTDNAVLVKNMAIKSNEATLIDVISAELYDEDEININQQVKEKLMKTLDPNCKIGTDQIAQQGFISHVTEENIFVQLKFVGLELLNNLMEKLTEDSLSNLNFKSKPVLRFDPTKIYVVEDSDRKWYRVKINTIINENEAQVTCIDVGNSIKVNKQKLVLLEELSDLLAQFPKQAIQVQLHKISPIDFDKKMAAHLRDLAPKTELFYLKVVGIHEEVPRVEFYKRTENNFLASLNDTLVLEPKIQPKDDNNNAKPRIRNNRSSIDVCSEFPLKSPNVPPIDQFFDVHVTMAAHPGNFTVQPLDTLKDLEKLMLELSRVCNSYTGPALTPSAIKVGNMYAAKYDDGRWYRAYVSKIISKNICAVYFCDYGDYRAVSLDLLQPLQNQFYDLPYQAMKAKLHGITPKLKNDWSVKDTLRFNQLIASKSFVSVIKSCDMDNLQSGDPVLIIELIDTSTDVDINISDILIKENRANKVDEVKV